MRTIAAKLYAALVIPGVVVLAAACSSQPEQPGFARVTDAVLQNPEPADWLRWRRDNGASGFSPLDQVTSENCSECAAGRSYVSLHHKISNR